MNRTTISQIIEQAGYQTVSLDFYRKIDEWKKWYKGKVDNFHEYDVFLAKGQKTCVKMQSLGMPKKICEDWADLLYNEKTFIVIDDTSLQKVFNDVLLDNNFESLGNELVEKSFMAGTGAFVLRKDKYDKTKIDYVVGDMIFPLDWENGQVTSCAFGCVVVRGGVKYFHLQAHEKKGLSPQESMARGSRYVVSNRFYKINKHTGNINLNAVSFDDVASEVTYDTGTPLFALIKPAIANNIDENNPLGVSIYANAIDQIKACDIAFDGSGLAMKVGRPRIAVSSFAVEVDSEGNVIPIIDKRDVVLYNLPAKVGDKESLIKDITPAYKANEYMETLEKNLLLLSQRVGFGERAYRFDNGSVATATQVIAENSKMFRTMKKHQKILSHAFKQLAQGIFYLSGYGDREVTITVNFDDSIIEDTGSKKAQMLAEVQAGIVNKYEYRQEFYGEDEAKAKANVPQEKTYPAFDFTDSGNA